MLLDSIVTAILDQPQRGKNVVKQMKPFIHTQLFVANHHVRGKKPKRNIFFSGHN